MSLMRKSKPKILVVDDEPDNLDLLYRTFRRLYRVVRSDSAPEALNILAEDPEIAVIISDQRMPQMSGTEFLKIAATSYPNTMRIMLTGYTDVEDLVDAINEGRVYKYVTKPWDAEELKSIVEQALETHNLLKIRTRELSRSLRRESLLNSVLNTIRNRRFDNPESSPLQDVLQSIVNTLGEAMEVDVALLKPLDAEVSVSSPYFLYQRSPARFQEKSIAWGETLWEVTEPTILNDIKTQDELFQSTPIRQAAFELSDIESTLIVPLMFQDETSALLALHHCDIPHRWEEDEVQLVKMVADQAVLAISQARAYEKVQDLAQRETLINTITTAIRSSLEPEEIFRAITKQLGQALDVDGCALSLWTEDDDVVTCVGLYDAHANDDDDPLEMPQSSVPIAQNPVLQDVLDSLQPVVYNDMKKEENLEKYDLPLRIPARALLLVPMVTDGQLIGTISLRQTDGPRIWLNSDIELAQSVAAQAAIAVQQSRLYEKTRLQAEQLREREQKVKQLNKYLTESVLKRFLPETMVNKAAAGELTLDLRPEPRLVTILFSDIVGFTPLSSKLGPQLIAELLNEYLEAMTQAVFDNRGTVDKFIGDAVLALFGSPEELAPQEQAERAIAVAKAMGENLHQLNREWQTRGILGTDDRPPLMQVRCGIHQGNAVVGMFGGGQRSDYTAIGPAVNMAARLQETATPMHVYISETVAKHLDDSHNLTLNDDLHLKGIDESIRAYSFPLHNGT
ncbi:adenylate/guanylate cyclase with GAF sensor(s) [[Leptolyngbya] sp. PCC 7376]|uniref:GAF domain-containing protein n=1 Tax=[Leptolyngbya] sp. PCC 7376 TaxID=111781 RepID=UPI00029F4D5E|nr:GAF domain-containing protein [[Leptolyngbya] sp. PCC 7376]AFY40437.1 adenylate/guanylate cyclase with GAF sensor(s) [[Leptolyngbya] sp. PCC 7376]